MSGSRRPIVPTGVASLAGRHGAVVGVQLVGLPEPVLLQRLLLEVAGLGLLRTLLGALGVDLGAFSVKTCLLGLQPLLLRSQLGIGEHAGVPTRLVTQLCRTGPAFLVPPLFLALQQEPGKRGEGQHDGDRNDDPDDLISVHDVRYPQPDAS